MALSEEEKKKIQEEEEFRAKAKSEAQITYARSAKDKKYKLINLSKTLFLS